MGRGPGAGDRGGARVGRSSVRVGYEHVFVENPNLKGAIAEVEIEAAAIRLGVDVLRPVSQHARYDLAFEVRGRLWRVQCKWGQLDPPGEVIGVRLGGNRCTPGGYVRSTYEEGEIDLLAVYCAALDRCFLLPESMVLGRHFLHLRVQPPRNAQRACINLAADFHLAGAIAQLGERSDGIRKVVGSSPTSSTFAKPPVRHIGAHEFREHFGYWMEQVARSGAEITVTRRDKPYVRLSPAVGAQHPTSAPAAGPPSTRG